MFSQVPRPFGARRGEGGGGLQAAFLPLVLERIRYLFDKTNSPRSTPSAEMLRGVMSEIYRLIYTSANNLAPADNPLLVVFNPILQVSRRNNERDGITRYLFAEPRWFLQVLEGPEYNIRTT